MRASNSAFPCDEVTGVLIGGIWHNITTGSFRLEQYLFSMSPLRAIRPPGSGTDSHQAYRFISAGDEFFGPVSAIQGVRGRAD
jgi:hypothetical protein